MKTLTIKRTFDAPAEKVWDAWTDVETLKKWWAPPGMHNAHMEADVREGGRFLYCFKTDKGGEEYWGRGIYKKIDEPHYLSYLDSFTDEKGNDVGPGHYGMGGDAVVETLAEVTLEERDGRTHLTLEGENPYDEEMTKGMTDGWNGMFDNLEKVLAA